ncbi:hypothetical protein Efla_000284 [Eimeria flavescens]
MEEMQEEEVSSACIPAAEGPPERVGSRRCGFKSEYRSPSPANAASPEAAVRTPSSTTRKLAVIPPYWNLYITNCKLRWREKRLLDAFSAEFSWKSPQYFRDSMERGASVDVKDEIEEFEGEDGMKTRGGVGAPPGAPHSAAKFFQVFMQVNWSACTPDQILRNGDVIIHNSLVMELAAPSRPVYILHEDASVLCVCKPSGIPVHPQGLYRAQSLLNRLKLHHFKSEDVYLHPINRLDRVTSGLVIFAKEAAAARSLTTSLAAAGKVYLCQVRGRFSAVFESVKAAAEAPQEEEEGPQVSSSLPSEGRTKRMNATTETSHARQVTFSFLSSSLGEACEFAGLSNGNPLHSPYELQSMPSRGTAAEAGEQQKETQQQHQPGQQQQQQQVDRETVAAVTGGGCGKAASNRSQRRELKRQKKLQKLLVKQQEEERRQQKRLLRHQLAEAAFDLTDAARRGLLQPFVMGASLNDADVPGTPAAIQAAAAAAAAAAGGAAAGDGGEAAVKGLFTGHTPFLLMQAKLRNVQASTLLLAAAETQGHQESAAAAAAENEEVEDLHANEGQKQSKAAQLLMALWDEENGKHAETVFAQLAFCEQTNTSLVLAMPLTGRSHQIRKHLSILGHPIVGDTLYTSRQEQQQHRQGEAEKPSDEQPGAEGSRGEGKPLESLQAAHRAADLPQEWWVRFSLEELRHLLPCSCNPKKAASNGKNDCCENDVAWHLRFLQRAVQTAGGQAAIPHDEDETLEVLYKLEVPDSICLFALFYKFPPTPEDKADTGVLHPATAHSEASREAEKSKSRSFNCLPAPPPWAAAFLHKLRETFEEALPRLAELKSHLPRSHPPAAACSLEEETFLHAED